MNMGFDKLDVICTENKQLTNEILRKHNLQLTPKEQIRLQIENLHHEASSLWNKLHVKYWRPPEEPDWNGVKEDAVDILHFALNILQALGMNSVDIYNAYIEKNKENNDRQSKWQRLGTSYKPE